MDLPKDESETKSGVMPNWRLIQPTLILHTEHFMVNDNPRNFVKEQIDKNVEELNVGTDTKSSDSKGPSSDRHNGKLSKSKQKFKTIKGINHSLKKLE